MPWSYEHLNWLTDTDQTITTVCGKQAKVYHFEYDITDHTTMKKWAKHFRNHYCSDAEIAILKAPHQETSEYLINMKFPSRSIAPGPSIRAGDFAEILVADYLERFKKFDVPRTRYDRKAVPNESTKGSDVIAFKLAPDISDNDELLVFEVKAKLTGTSKDMLQEAIDHSAKDELRLAESLNGMKQRLWDRKELKKVELVTRFQNPVDQPYRQTYGAAAVCSSSVFDPRVLSGADSSKHPHHQDLELITFHGEELMELVHALYELAANEI